MVLKGLKRVKFHFHNLCLYYVIYAQHSTAFFSTLSTFRRVYFQTLSLIEFRNTWIMLALCTAFLKDFEARYSGQKFSSRESVSFSTFFDRPH